MTTLQETQGFKRERGFFSKSVIFFVILFSLSNNVFSAITQKAGTTLPVGATGQNICISNIPAGPSEDGVKALFETTCPDGLINVSKSGTPVITGSNWNVDYNYVISNTCDTTRIIFTVTYSGGDTESPSLTGTPTTGVTGINSCMASAAATETFKPALALEGYTDNCSTILTAIQTTSGITGNDSSWTLTYNYTVSDEAGNITTGSYTVTGGDTQAPQFDGTISSVTGVESCKANALSAAPFDAAIALIGYSDDCSTNLTVDIAGTSAVTGDDKSWTFTYTYTVSDEAGNSKTGTYTVTGGDKTAPQFDGNGYSLTDANACLNDALSSYPFITTNALKGYTDNCGGGLIVLNQTHQITGSNAGWTITYKYDISDYAGNIITGRTYTVTGRDKIFPALTTPSYSLSNANACFGTATTLYPFNTSHAVQGYTDNCGGTLTVTNPTSQVTGDNANWTITYTYDISDDAGNKLTGLTYTVSGKDQTAPSLTGTPYSLSNVNACYADALTTVQFLPQNAIQGYSDCSGPINATKTGETIEGTNASWTITYTYSISDQLGNTLSGVTYKVSGGDRTAPLLTGTAYSLTNVNHCYSSALSTYSFNSALALQGYTDNCGGTLNAINNSSVISGSNSLWTITHTFDVVDDAGNSLPGRTYTISGKDQNPPTFGNVNNLKVDGTSTSRLTLVTNWLSNVTATDGCGGTVKVTNDLVTSTINWDCDTKTVTFTATDSAGNQTTLTRTLQVSSIVLEGPLANVTRSACDFTNQEELNAAYELFKSEFRVIKNGCTLAKTFTPDSAPLICEEGTSSVTLTVNDGINTKTITRTFTITPCTTFTSIAQGDWSNPATWLRGCVPSNTGDLLKGAIIVVNHDITLDGSFITGKNVNDVTFLVGKDNVCTLIIDGNFSMEKTVDIQIFAGSAFQIGTEQPTGYDYCTKNTGTNFTVDASNLDPSLTIHENATFTVYGNFTVNNRFDITVKAGGLYDIKGSFTAINTAEIGIYGTNESESIGNIGCDMDFLNSGFITMEKARFDIGGDLWFGNQSEINMANSTLNVIGIICSTEGIGNAAIVEIIVDDGDDDDYSIVTAKEICKTIDNPLPIELLSFTATIETENIKVLWQTASELNNNYFTIERSFDLTDWQVLGHVDGAGTVNEVRSYSFTDSNPESGINYYRLKQTDFDGAFEYFDPVAVNYESQEELEFEVLKNGSLWNVVVNSHEPFLLEVYTLTGRKIVSERGTYSIDFPNPVTGVVVRVISGTAGSSRVVM